MAQAAPSSTEIVAYSISPYLLRPLRSREQAKAEIAAKRLRSNVVSAFIPMMTTEHKENDGDQIAA